MKNTIQRVLAYQAATAISCADLDQVSGGNAQFSTRPSLHPTGHSIQDLDGTADVVADFD